MKNKLQLSLIAVSLGTIFSANATVYEIKNIDELYKVNGTIENSRSGFGVTANDNGLMIGGASGQFAPTLSDEDENLLVNNAVDTALTQASETSTYSPKALPSASNLIFSFDEDTIPTFLELFEETIEHDDFGDSVTVNSFAFDTNDDGIIVGTTSSVAYAITDPDEASTNLNQEYDFYAYDYRQRAFVLENGVVHTFEPEFSTYGGQSGITSINDNGLVVGYESVEVERYSLELLEERCLDTYADTIPLAICTQGFQYNSKSNNETLYTLEAVSWQYSNGSLTDRTPLGVLAQRVEDGGDNDYKYYRYNSFALDVNNNGVAVGQSVAFRDGKKEIKYRFDVATIFNDGEVIDLMDHSEDTWVASSSIAINDSDVVVGYVYKYINGTARRKMFVYEMAAPNPEMVFPNDFYSTESDFATYPKDINNDGLVVGAVDIDGGTTTSRRTHGFLYNHVSSDFEDINELLTCESKGYKQAGDTWNKYQIEASGGDGQRISYEVDISIVDASKITSNGTIMATALVTLPRVKTQWLDADGNVTTESSEYETEQLVTDANGDVVFDTDSSGAPITEEIPRAVILEPSQGTACEVIEDTSQSFVYERSGASLGLWGLLLAGLAFTRRKISLNK